MTNDDLTAEQLSAIAKALFPGVNYLLRLKARMQAKGFEPDDPLFVLACAAHEATNRLRLEVHARSASGNMKPPKQK